MKKPAHHTEPQHEPDWFIRIVELLGDIFRVVLLILGAMLAALIIGIIIGYIHYAVH